MEVGPEEVGWFEVGLFEGPVGIPALAARPSSPKKFSQLGAGARGGSATVTSVETWLAILRSSFSPVAAALRCGMTRGDEPADEAAPEAALEGPIEGTPGTARAGLAAPSWASWAARLPAAWVATCELPVFEGAGAPWGRWGEARLAATAEPCIESNAWGAKGAQTVAVSARLPSSAAGLGSTSPLSPNTSPSE